MWRTLLHPKFVLTKIKRFHIICFAWINYYLWRKYYYYVDYYYCCCCCFYNIFSWIRKKYKKVKWNNVRKQKKNNGEGRLTCFRSSHPISLIFLDLYFFSLSGLVLFLWMIMFSSAFFTRSTHEVSYFWTCAHIQEEKIFLVTIFFIYIIISTGLKLCLKYR